MRAKHWLGLFLMLAFVIVNVSYAATSSRSITYSSTGEMGKDQGFKAGKATVSGNQKNEVAKRTLYVAAQKQGHMWAGGVVFQKAVPAGTSKSASGTLAAGGHHVLLDPKGPGMSGCEGRGKLKQ